MPQIDEASRAIYRKIVSGEHTHGSAGRVTFCVYTADLEEGRGDVYVAAGLARALVPRGWGVRFLDRWHWHLAGRDTDLVVAMLETFDPAGVPGNVPVIAWVRNQTRVWAMSSNLPKYDAVLASSTPSLTELGRRVRVPVGLLPIGVDIALFHARTSAPRSGATTTVNHWGTERDLHRAVAAAPRGLPLTWYADRTHMSDSFAPYAAGAVSYFALPDAYRHASLVLDDMNHTTLPYGNVNSRLFEALGCGALPVTNGAIGLSELGLSEVPVYRTPEDLLAIVERHLQDPAHTAALTARLHDIVVDRHSFDRRAEQLLAFLPRAQENRGTKRARITYFPDYPDNPYQRLLYAETAAAGAQLAPTSTPGRVARDDGASLAGRILHVHWTAPIIQYAQGTYSAWRKFEQFRDAVADAKARGAKVLWTVHNVLPHDVRHRTIEIELHRFLAEAADLIHVLGPQTVATAAPLYDLPLEKIRVIEHCSYTGVYPDWIGRAAARRRLGTFEEEILLLLLGEIRPYKGLNILLPAFERVAATDPRLRLLVAGRPGRHGSLQPLLEQCRQHPRVLTSFEYVADCDIQVWMRAADIVVLPYSATLNSGALHLAQSFGRPVIAPSAGVVGAQLDPACSVSFRAGDTDSLTAAIREAVDRLVTEEARAAAAAAAAERPPGAMSASFLSLVMELLPDAEWQETPAATPDAIT